MFFFIALWAHFFVFLGILVEENIVFTNFFYFQKLKLFLKTKAARRRIFAALWYEIKVLKTAATKYLLKVFHKFY